MPNVNPNNQVNRSGQHTREDMLKAHRDVRARDNIKAAYAGHENKGPARSRKSDADQLHSTSLKGRNTLKSRERVPKR